MGKHTKETKKLSLVALVLMIFTSVFGFANMPKSFYLMGYGAIPWYLLSAITFFIPYAFMMAEYGAAFKNEKGGIYSWMDKSVGSKYAFVVTFMWYSSYIIWMVNTASTIWIPLSNLIFGKDVTASLSLFGLNSTQTLGILASIWIILVTFIGSKGLEKITKITSVGGIAVALLNIVVLIGGIVVLIANGGKLAQPIVHVKDFVQSTNPNYQTPINVLSFLVFAIFAYGGIEVVGGLVDETENAEVTFPKGIIVAAITIAIGYSISIFLCGIFTNWDKVLSSSKVNLGNIPYVIMRNLGYELGHAFGVSENISLQIGSWIARFSGLSMFLALTGAFFTLTYSPLKQLIKGTPKDLWPKKIGQVKNGMPINAMIVQCITVVIMILLVSFGGEGASQFFDKLVLMTNVAMTLPYIFIASAFISFKKKKSIKKPFEIYKNHKITLIVTIMVICTVGFANLFTIIQPVMNGDLKSTLWMIAGPVFFTTVALVIYSNYEKKIKIQSEDNVA